jgi:hypothetical protein
VAGPETSGFSEQHIKSLIHGEFAHPNVLAYVLQQYFIDNTCNSLEERAMIAVTVLHQSHTKPRLLTMKHPPSARS